MTQELSKTLVGPGSGQDVAYQSVVGCLRQWTVEIENLRVTALVLGLDEFARIIEDARARSQAALASIVQQSCRCGPGRVLSLTK